MSVDIAAKAWDLTKEDGDPTFYNTPQSHREDLTGRADGVIRTGLTINRFEEKVKELHAAEKAEAGSSPLGTTNALGEAPPEEASKPKADDGADDDDKIEEDKESLTGKSRDELDELAVENGLASSVEESKEKFGNMGLLRDAIEEARAK